ncbi:MAG: hypothetical protein ACFCU7_13685 [Pleurocapsa sp.]
MEKVVIIINAEVSDQGQLISASPVTQKMVEALQRSIANSSSKVIEIVSAAALWSRSSKINKIDQNNDSIYCPLTIQLPDYFDFPQRRIYSACKDINARRRWVEKNLGFKTSVGDSWLGHLWLPIIMTDKPMFTEVIGEGPMPNSYEHPVGIPKRQQKSLHALAEQLLDSLDALPATYLLQFSLYNGEIVFDRLWPFPAAPALITLKTQQPDLFTCHWHCLTNQPIANISISDPMPI